MLAKMDSPFIAFGLTLKIANLAFGINKYRKNRIYGSKMVEFLCLLIT
jgi:hypothetical protein